MIKCRTKQWGNSIGIILPKNVVEENKIKPHEEILIEIKGKSGNVLKELFGALPGLNVEDLKKARKELESKYWR